MHSPAIDLVKNQTQAISRLRVPVEIQRKIKAMLLDEGEMERHDVYMFGWSAGHMCDKSLCSVSIRARLKAHPDGILILEQYSIGSMVIPAFVLQCLLDLAEPRDAALVSLQVQKPEGHHLNTAMAFTS